MIRRNNAFLPFPLTLLSAALLAAVPALAQTTPPPPKPVSKEAPPAEGPVATVTVAASRPSNQIDRQVYDTKSDLGSSNNSAADALNNIPSVTVDPDGTVLLRGSAHVQILIDGKPSAMLQGDNRGPTLASMPAEDIESIEVINNPGAQFGNEAGGGPILNIIMKRTRKPGGLGSFNANAGQAGRYNASSGGTYNSGRFGVQGSAYFRHDGRNSWGDAERLRIVPSTGVFNRSRQLSESSGLTDAAGVNSTVHYNLGDKDTLSASAGYARNSNGLHALDRYTSFGTDDIADSDYQRTTRRGGASDKYTWGARVDHKGYQPGEVIKFDLRVSSAINASENSYANTYVLRPAGARDSQGRQNNRTGNRIADFTTDLEQPGEQGMLKAGYKIATNKSSFDTRYTNIDPLTQAESLNLVRTNEYELNETTLALYGSYQMRLNERWGVLGGLRAEYTSMDIAQRTSGFDASNHYLNAIPSAFVSYKASEDTNIRFSYAHRIRRPGAGDLNPFVVYRDEFNVSSGNPALKPSQTDSFELGYETRFGQLDANLRGYFRRNSDLISERKVFISDTVLLTTRDNAGSNHAGGLEFTLSGKLLPTLTINTSGNLAYTEQRIATITPGVYTMRSAESLTARARVNWTVTEQDKLQVAVTAVGRALLGQGYRQPYSNTSVNYRHAISPMLDVVFNVNDLFNTNRIETVTDNDILKETNVRHYDGRLMYLGLSYRFGGVTGMRRGPGGMGQGPRGG
ncbi:TonB-dependent receptor [Massilia sp. R2A-15]|uniref:TonB-dependent receptor domain-containing protein n=1 Tax=Massilia sp. R2A-15 TaxID=3064278 RepID=UPI00273578E5|nr:TonB-dependent receptor [Massilia sp. R2A-15]WLI91371.1 TonB-dependent receptor [Massilia sp. R2A-15]